MKVYGAATFVKDEDVVVFAEHRGAAQYVVGMAQGKLQLYRDAAGTRRLKRDLSEVSFTRAVTPEERTLSAHPAATKPAVAISSLDELAAEVSRLKTAAKHP